jgi:hypothetical protein
MDRHAGRRVRSALGAAAAALLWASCTLGAEEAPRDAATSPPAAGPVTPAPAAPGPPASASELPGRLLVQLADGDLVTVRPDGSDVQALVEDAGTDLRVLQAAWAPDGSRVAWSQIDTFDGAATGRIVTADPDGGGRRETALDVAPFYLSWDPTSRRVGYLGADGSDRFHMGVVDDAGGHLLARGSPFYFAWSPSGDRVLAHIGAERLEELDLAGDRDRLPSREGVYQAPLWSDDGRTQVYVERRGGGELQRIVARDTRTGDVRTLATADGAVSLVMSPDGATVAFQALNDDERDLYDRTLPMRATDVGVTVVDVATGRAERVTIRPAVAFFWSPDGERLLILQPEYPPAGPLSFRWVVSDGDDAFETDAFTPGISLLAEYAPFFSQYAQSLTMWAPDGSAFAYPADRPPNPTQIWIQPVDGSPAFALGAGSFVAWAPER